MTRRLSLFGALHFDRLSKVEDELTEYAEDSAADAIFIEWPAEDITRRTVVVGALRTPVVLLGTLFAGLIQGVAFAVFNRRLDSTEHITANRLSAHYPLYEIDRNLFSLMAGTGVLATLVNWVIVCGFFAVTPIRTAITVGAVVACGVVVNLTALRSRRLAAVSALMVGTGFVSLVVTDRFSGWFLAALGVGFGVFVKRVHDTRNRHMMGRVATISEEEGYDSSVLVTGRAHLSGLAELTADMGLTLSRTYTPRWLRAPGKIEENPTVESDERREETSEDDRSGELGSVGARAAASLVDFIVLAVLVWIPARAILDTVFVGVLSGFVAVLLLALAYYVVLEAAFGCTVGKRLANLVVTDVKGSPPSLRACLFRNLLRPVDFLVFYLVGFLVVVLTDRHQRLGDLAAGTEVRKTR